MANPSSRARLTKLLSSTSLTLFIVALAVGCVPSPLPAPTPTTFSYQVRVQLEDGGAYISNAKVTLEVSGQAPLDSITDANGLARIFVGVSHVGKPGMLIVEATGYETFCP